MIKPLISLLLLLLLNLQYIYCFQKRAPPFTQSDLPAHLGTYTHSHENIEKPTYTCKVIGECQECGSLEKKTAPFCLEYGNKQQVRCEWDDPNLVLNGNDALIDDDYISLPIFQGCPWVKHVEKWKIIKFEAINFIIAVFSVIILIWRQKSLAREKYQQLAQRIGLPV